MAEELYHRREFLNRDSGIAAIECKISIYGEGEDKSVESEISISDCGRTVTLDFGSWTVFSDKSFDDLISKAQTMRDVVVEFTDTIIKYYTDLSK